jgi:hypothetical protein
MSWDFCSPAERAKDPLVPVKDASDFIAKGEPDLITRAALDVATETLRALADDLEAVDRADTCSAARTIRAVLRTLVTAGATPEKPWQRDARLKRKEGGRA